MCATVSSPGRMHPILPFVGEMLVEVFERDGRANEAHEPQIEGYDRGLFFQASSSGTKVSERAHSRHVAHLLVHETIYNYYSNSSLQLPPLPLLPAPIYVRTAVDGAAGQGFSA